MNSYYTDVSLKQTGDGSNVSNPVLVVDGGSCGATGAGINSCHIFRSLFLKHKIKVMSIMFW